MCTFCDNGFWIVQVSRRPAQEQTANILKAIVQVTRQCTGSRRLDVLLRATVSSSFFHERRAIGTLVNVAREYLRIPVGRGIRHHVLHIRLPWSSLTSECSLTVAASPGISSGPAHRPCLSRRSMQASYIICFVGPDVWTIPRFCI